jgi:hypothetical protein
MESEEINPLLEKYKKTITRDIIKKLYEKYSIYDEDENEISEKEIKDYLEKLNNPTKKRCCGVSKTGVPKQCKSFAVTNFDYCKNHMMTYGACSSLRRKNEIEENIDVEICKNTVGDDIDLSHLKMKFIEDSFYYIDKSFIYNKLKQKVGYIDNGEFILTDDPYILNNNF